MLKRNSNAISRSSEVVSEFLRREPLHNSTLTLDGTGVNGSLQYKVLSHIGLQRLDALKKVNVVSASTYAYLFFRAYHNGALTLDESAMKRWDANNRRHHDVATLRTAAKLAINRLTGKRSALSGKGFSDAYLSSITESFSRLRVADMPANANFWLYCHTDRKLICLNANNEYQSWPLTDVIRAAPSVPGLFSMAEIHGKKYYDPVYSPAAKEMYRIMRGESGPHLFSNMRREGVSNNVSYFKPHDMRSGDMLILKDFMLFILGLPNASVWQSIQSGLINSNEVNA